MTFVLKAGVINRPLPAYRTADGCRWEYRCSWCDQVFMSAAELVAHVLKERSP